MDSEQMKYCMKARCAAWHLVSARRMGLNGWLPLGASQNPPPAEGEMGYKGRGCFRNGWKVCVLCAALVVHKAMRTELTGLCLRHFPHAVTGFESKEERMDGSEMDEGRVCCCRFLRARRIGLAGLLLTFSAWKAMKMRL